MSESLFDNVKYNIVTDLVDQGKETVQHIEECLNKVNERLYSKDVLFKRAVDIYEQMATLKEDLKALKEDFTYDEDMNPKGMDKDEVKEVVAFANKYVADGVEKLLETAATYKQLKEELVGG